MSTHETHYPLQDPDEAHPDWLSLLGLVTTGEDSVVYEPPRSVPAGSGLLDLDDWDLGVPATVTSLDEERRRRRLAGRRLRFGRPRA